MVLHVRVFITCILLNSVHLLTHSPTVTSLCSQDHKTTCSTDCSQKHARLEGDTTFFNCTIGNKNDKDAFREQRKTDLHKTQFSPPSLESVNVYYKGSGNHSEASLGINIMLPEGQVIPEWELPEAVFVTFQSITDSDYYYKCPLERIFRFWNYRPNNSYDYDHPRNISYNCIGPIGLESLQDVLLYNLTLQTFKGRAADFIVKVPVLERSFERYARFWRPVIATYYDQQQSIHVIIEQQPEWMNKPDLAVLEKLGFMESQKKHLHRSRRSIRFDGLSPGRYVVRVAYDNCSECKEMTSEVIEIKSLEDNDHSTQHDMELSTVAGIVVGCVVVTVIAVTAAYFLVIRKTKEQNTSFKPNNKTEEEAMLKDSQPAMLGNKLNGVNTENASLFIEKHNSNGFVPKFDLKDSGIHSDKRNNSVYRNGFADLQNPTGEFSRCQSNNTSSSRDQIKNGFTKGSNSSKSCYGSSGKCSCGSKRSSAMSCRAASIAGKDIEADNTFLKNSSGSYILSVDAIVHNDDDSSAVRRSTNEHTYSPQNMHNLETRPKFYCDSSADLEQKSDFPPTERNYPAGYGNEPASQRSVPTMPEYSRSSVPSQMSNGKHYLPIPEKADIRSRIEPGCRSLSNPQEHNLIHSNFDYNWIPVSSEESLWDSGSEECCGGRHRHITCDKLFDERPSFTQLPPVVDCSVIANSDVNRFQSALSAIRQLNNSEELLTMPS